MSTLFCRLEPKPDEYQKLIREGAPDLWRQKVWIGTYFAGEESLDQHEIRLRGLHGFNDCDFVCWQREVSPHTGREHLQFCLHTTKQLRTSAARALVPGAWLVAASGTLRQCIAYCTKAATRAEGAEPVQLGEAKEQGQRTDIANLHHLAIQPGSKVDDLLLQDDQVGVTAMKFAKQLREVVSAREFRDLANSRDKIFEDGGMPLPDGQRLKLPGIADKRNIVYVWGDSSVGKSLHFDWLRGSLPGQVGYPGAIYTVDGSSQHGFDGYRGERILLWDELPTPSLGRFTRDNHALNQERIEWLKQWSNFGHPKEFTARYKNNPTPDGRLVFVILSNQSPENYFGVFSLPDPLANRMVLGLDGNPGLHITTPVYKLDCAWKRVFIQ